MNRRQFLQGALAVGAVLAVPFKWAYEIVRHRLYADGVTDDTEAVQALLDGKPVLMPDGVVQHVPSYQHMAKVPAGHYRIDDSIRLDGDKGLYLNPDVRVVRVTRPPQSDRPIVQMSGNWNILRGG